MQELLKCHHRGLSYHNCRP